MTRSAVVTHPQLGRAIALDGTRALAIADADAARLADRLLVEHGTSSGAGGRAALVELLAEAWLLGGRVALGEAQHKRVCRVCGCSQLNACVPACAWATDDLCTACEPSEGGR